MNTVLQSPVAQHEYVHADCQPGLLWVDREGCIVDCCDHAEAMFGYRAGQLHGRHVTALLPDLAEVDLLRNGTINPELAFRCRCAAPFRAAQRDGSERPCSLFVSQAVLPDGPAVRLVVRPRGGPTDVRRRPESGAAPR